MLAPLWRPRLLLLLSFKASPRCYGPARRGGGQLPMLLAGLAAQQQLRSHLPVGGLQAMPFAIVAGLAPRQVQQLQAAAAAASRRSCRVQARATISTGSGKKPKEVYVCDNCGKEHAQWMGQCTGCKAWQTLNAHTIAPEPAAPSGAAAAAAALRGASSGSVRARSGSRSGRAGLAASQPAGGGSSWYNDTRVTYAAAGAAGDDDGGEYGDDDDDYSSSSSSSSSSSWTPVRRGGWVSVDEQRASAPRRLDLMSFSADQLRLPLHGALGREVCRVLGGGVVPGSLVLVGGEPGLGKSTLLLQVAALIAHTTRHAAQAGLQQVADGAAASAAAAANDDVPLAQRRTAAAAAAGAGPPGSSSSGGGGGIAQRPGWLEDAAAEAAAAGVPARAPCYAGRPVIYFTAEESEQQVWERARRLGVLAGSASGGGASKSPPLELLLLVENRADVIASHIAELRPAAVIIDSIQTVALSSLPQLAGSVTQVRESAACLLHVSKQVDCAAFLVGHVTKAGGLAGPKHLEHLVDVVLALQHEGGGGGLRLLRATKNRHGRVGEVGVLEMCGPGLAVVDPASRLLSDPPRRSSDSTADSSSDGGATTSLLGTSVGLLMEGLRPLPVEIQALAASRLLDGPPGRHISGLGDDGDDAPASDDDEAAEGEHDDDGDDDAAGGALYYSSSSSSSGGGGGVLDGRRQRAASDGGGGPRELAPLIRSFVGVRDTGRMHMLLELLSKHSAIKCGRLSLYVNVIGGRRIPPGETATDLALLAAVASSATGVGLPRGVVLVAEVGLGGELRPPPGLEARLREAASLGFRQAVVPAGTSLTLDAAELPGGMALVALPSLGAALAHLLGPSVLPRPSGVQGGRRSHRSSSSSRRAASELAGTGGQQQRPGRRRQPTAP